MKDSELPSLPTVALRLLRMMSDPKVSAHDLTQAIQADPALAGKLLRVANSADKAGTRRIADLRRAVLFLGARKVTAVALSFSLAADSMTNSAYREWYSRFWFRSLTIAISAELISRHLQLASSNDAFVVGLLCNVGHLAALMNFPDSYVTAIDDAENPLSRDERSLTPFGESSQLLTQRIIQTWNLPESTLSTIRGSEQMLKEGTWRDASGSVAILLASIAMGDFFDGTNRAAAMRQLDHLLCEALEVSEGDLQRLLGEIRHQLTEYEDLFDLNSTTLPDIADLLTEAKEFLSSMVVGETPVYWTNSDVDRVAEAVADWSNGLPPNAEQAAVLVLQYRNNSSQPCDANIDMECLQKSIARQLPELAEVREFDNQLLIVLSVVQSDDDFLILARKVRQLAADAVPATGKEGPCRLHWGGFIRPLTPGASEPLVHDITKFLTTSELHESRSFTFTDLTDSQAFLVR